MSILSSISNLASKAVSSVKSYFSPPSTPSPPKYTSVPAYTPPTHFTPPPSANPLVVGKGTISGMPLSSVTSFEHEVAKAAIIGAAGVTAGLGAAALPAGTGTALATTSLKGASVVGKKSLDVLGKVATKIGSGLIKHPYLTALNTLVAGPTIAGVIAEDPLIPFKLMKKGFNVGKTLTKEIEEHPYLATAIAAVPTGVAGYEIYKNFFGADETEKIIDEEEQLVSDTENLVGGDTKMNASPATVLGAPTSTPAASDVPLTPATREVGKNITHRRKKKKQPIPTQKTPNIRVSILNSNQIYL